MSAEPPHDPSVVAQPLGSMLRSAVTMGASDVHLRSGAPPFVRVAGQLSRTTAPVLSEQFVRDVIALTSGATRPFDSSESWEYSFDQPGIARFRGHVFRETGGWAVVFRVVPLQVPSFQDLRLPPVAKVLSTSGPGLVLVTGPTGSGKSTTVASLIRFLASSETVHVLTVEDPIEYRFVDLPSCVTQREVGRDTSSYSNALRAALREDPDVLFLGEVRDLETLDVAMQAAETGHTVFTTFHTSSALKTIQRLVSMLPTDEQATGRARLADSLRGIICQRLVPRRGLRTRILCPEVLVNNYAIREAIRDSARTPTIPTVLERSADQGMQTFDQALATLVREQLVAPDVALHYASSPTDFRRSIGMLG